MNAFKKTLMIILSVAMLTVLSVSAASADAVDFCLKTDYGSAKAGETVELKLNLSNNPGFSYLRVTVEFDDEALTLTETRNGNILSDLDVGINLVWSANSDSTENGTLATLVFKIKENAARGEYPVTVKVRECYNDGYDEVLINQVNGGITVECTHTWDGGTVTVPATHTENGEKTMTCMGCEETVTEPIAALGHSYTERKTEAQYLKSEATCTASAQYYFSCTCGEKGNESFSDGNALGHIHGEWTVVREPAVGIAGEKQMSCMVCGAILESEPIAALVAATEAPSDSQPELPSDSEPSPDEKKKGGCSGTLATNVALLSLLLSAASVLLCGKRKEGI